MGEGCVCERPPQPCPAYSFSWRPSLMPVSHAAGDEHFTATVQFLCLGTLTYSASSKRILFTGLCWDRSALEIRLIVWISCRTRCCLFINILFSWKCTQMTLWRGHCVRGSGLFSLDNPDSLKILVCFPLFDAAVANFFLLFCFCFLSVCLVINSRWRLILEDSTYISANHTLYMDMVWGQLSETFSSS